MLAPPPIRPGIGHRFPCSWPTVTGRSPLVGQGGRELAGAVEMRTEGEIQLEGGQS